MGVKRVVIISAGFSQGLNRVLLPAAARCHMVLHQESRARHSFKRGFGGEVLQGVKSGVSCETSTTMDVTPHLHRVYSGGRKCALMGVPWRGASFSTLGMG